MSKKTIEMSLAIADLTLDKRLQSRVKMDSGVISDYTENVQLLPPVSVIREGEVFWLWDGHQTVKAHQKADIKDIKCLVEEGTFLDALELSVGANAAHGLQRTDEDKERAVKNLFSEPAWRGRSDRMVAEKCKVSHPFVAKVRKSLGIDPVTDDTQPTERTGKDGKQRSAVNDTHEKNGEAAKKKVCDRCARVGPVKDCPMCAELNKKDAASTSDKPKKKEKKVVDAFGVEVPRQAKAAFADPWMQDTIDFLAEIGEMIRKQKIAQGMTKRAAHYPFINKKDVVDGLGMATNALEGIMEHLKENRPAAVCPACDGEGCARCKHGRVVPRSVHKALKAQAKEKAAAK